jgi:hypothetical protein
MHGVGAKKKLFNGRVEKKFARRLTLRESGPWLVHCGRAPWDSC